MPKEVFNDQFLTDGSGNKLFVRWGAFGTVELGLENPVPLRQFVAALDEDNSENVDYYGFWLSLSKDELQRLIKVLTRAARQYDSIEERASVPETDVVEIPVEVEPTGEITETV